MKKMAVCLMMMAFLVSAAFFGCGKKESTEAVKEVTTVATEAEEPILKGMSARNAQGKFEGFIVYIDQGYFKNHFSPSGWMGDFGDLKINEAWKDNVHSRKSCIKVTYQASATQGANWAGVYWQNPPNNWGDKKGGFDLTGAKKLSFWAKGEKGGEVIAEFKLGGITGTYCDTDSASLGPITFNNQWQEYSIDLTGMDLSYISGGFCFVIKRMDNPEGCIFYLDDIRYE